EEIDQFHAIAAWERTTETGDRAEIDVLPESSALWHKLDARTEACLGQSCPDWERCFVTAMRRKALESDIVIVNHHLFFADLAMRGGDYGSVLPDYSTVIFDEAHELEDVAATYFGVNASNYRVLDLIQDCQKLTLTEPDRSSEVTRALARLSQAAERFWVAIARQDLSRTRGGDTATSSSTSSSSSLEDGGWAASVEYSSQGLDARGQSASSVLGIAEGRYVLDSSIFVRRAQSGFEPTAAGEAYMSVMSSLNRLGAELAAVRDPAPEVDNIVRRVEGLKFDLEFIVMSDDPSFVYWLEKRGRGYFLYATPIDVSSLIADKLFAAVQSAVLTSATLTADERFDFIKSRLGIGHAREVVVESHFDFRRQAVLYLPKKMPDPRAIQYTKAAADEIVKILEATSGRAFVLFTSVASMRSTYELVRDRIDFPSFVQGQGSKAGLLEKFRRTEGAVLFATSSFWQGVDVQGEALSCVIIHKLPFAVPSDPVVAARQRHIDSEGGNSFYDYSVPEAIITLKQGLG
ncbi:MAG: ATP-dependent DNA helicase, partial [Blastocatellia bacterium]